jgi:hypothetical protein
MMLKTIKSSSFIGCLIMVVINTGKADNIFESNILIDKDSIIVKDSIFAAYQYRASDGLAGATIKLKCDKSFSYSTGTDIQQSFSSGKWNIVKDTLILTSFFKRDNIPVTIKEIKTETKDSLVISWVKNLNNDVVKDATVYFNNDTLAGCMPVFDDCKVMSGSIKKIKLAFNNNCSTRWYELKDVTINKIDPIVNVDFPFDSYVFLADKKYLMGKKGLYELQEKVKNVKGTAKGFLIKEKSFFKRIK